MLKRQVALLIDLNSFPKSFTIKKEDQQHESTTEIDATTSENGGDEYQYQTQPKIEVNPGTGTSSNDFLKLLQIFQPKAPSNPTPTPPPPPQPTITNKSTKYCTYPTIQALQVLSPLTKNTTEPNNNSQQLNNNNNNNDNNNKDEELTEEEENTISENIKYFKELLLENLFKIATEDVDQKFFNPDSIQWCYQFFDSSVEVNKYKAFNCKRFLPFNFEKYVQFEVILETEIKKFISEKKKKQVKNIEESNRLTCLSNSLKNIVTDLQWDQQQQLSSSSSFDERNQSYGAAAAQNSIYVFHHLPTTEIELENFANGHISISKTITPKTLRDALLPSDFRQVILIKYRIKLCFVDIEKILGTESDITDGLRTEVRTSLNSTTNNELQSLVPFSNIQPISNGGNEILESSNELTALALVPYLKSNEEPQQPTKTTELKNNNKTTGIIRGLLRLLEATNETNDQRTKLKAGLYWYDCFLKGMLELSSNGGKIMKKVPQVKTCVNNNIGVKKGDRLIKKEEEETKSSIMSGSDQLLTSFPPTVKSLLAESPIPIYRMKEMNPIKKVDDWHQRCLMLTKQEEEETQSVPPSVLEDSAVAIGGGDDNSILSNVDTNVDDTESESTDDEGEGRRPSRQEFTRRRKKKKIINTLNDSLEPSSISFSSRPARNARGKELPTTLMRKRINNSSSLREQLNASLPIIQNNKTVTTRKLNNNRQLSNLSFISARTSLSSNSFEKEKDKNTAKVKNTSFINAHNSTRPILVSKDNIGKMKRQQSSDMMKFRIPTATTSGYYETRSKTTTRRGELVSNSSSKDIINDDDISDPYIYQSNIRSRPSPNRVRRNLIFDINKSVAKAKEAVAASISSPSSPASVLRATPLKISAKKKVLKSKRKLNLSEEKKEMKTSNFTLPSFELVASSSREHSFLLTPPSKKRRMHASNDDDDQQDEEEPTVIEASPDLNNRNNNSCRPLERQSCSRTLTKVNSATFYGTNTNDSTLNNINNNNKNNESTSSSQSKIWELSSNQIEAEKLKNSVEEAKVFLANMTSMQDFEIVPSSSPESNHHKDGGLLSSPEEVKTPKSTGEGKLTSTSIYEYIQYFKSPRVRGISNLAINEQRRVSPGDQPLPNIKTENTTNVNLSLSPIVLSIGPSSTKNAAKNTTPTNTNTSFNSALQPLVLATSEPSFKSPRRSGRKTYQPSPLALHSSPATKQCQALPAINISAVSLTSSSTKSAISAKKHTSIFDLSDSD